MVTGVLDKNCQDTERANSTQDSLQERWKPVIKRKRLAPVAISISATHTLPNILLVEAKPDPRDEETELYDDIRTLEAKNANYGRERDIGHG